MQAEKAEVQGGLVTSRTSISKSKLSQFLSIVGGKSVMQARKFRTLSAMTAGSLTLAVVAIMASSGPSQAATHAVLAARTESFLQKDSPGTPSGQLNPGQLITSGTQIASPDGRFVLQMQSDGNLVIRAPGNMPIGDTHTAGHNGTIAVMQADGNFVLRAPGNIPVWASGTDGHPGTVLQVQDDGGVVLYAPGHKVLRVLFPAFLDPGKSVSTPTLLPVTTPATQPSASGLVPSSPTLPGTLPPVKSPSILKQLEEEAGGTFEDPDVLAGLGCAGLSAGALAAAAPLGPVAGAVGLGVGLGCVIDTVPVPDAG